MSDMRGNGLQSNYAKMSNFGDGPLPVGHSQSMNFYGCFDLTGNVREWLWTETPEGRAIQGGAWNDAIYMMSAGTHASPFDRDSRNGFRCVIYPDIEDIPKEVFQPVTGASLGRRFLPLEKSVSDEVFKVYKSQFAYDKSDLEAKIEEVDESPEDWIRQTVSFNAAYDDDRILAQLYLPKSGTPPFHVIVFFPGDFSTWEASSKDVWYEQKMFDFILSDGRAVLYPVYWGTYERRTENSRNMIMAFDKRSQIEALTKIIQDFRRSVDYLETRKDIDSQMIAYYGYSWGGLMGGIIPAVEERVRVNILVCGGLATKMKEFAMQSEIDQVHYIPRVKVPTLMLNGMYDRIYPYEETVVPFYERLGTPEEDKDLKTYDTDHFVPRNDLVKEVLGWLDKYFGPARK